MPPIKKAKPKFKRKPTLVAIGVDTSMSSIACAGIMWDGTLGKIQGPVWSIHRWNTDDWYYKRMREAACSHNFILDLLAQFKAPVDLDEVHVGVEEISFGYITKGKSSYIKQQMQIQSCFLGGLLRFGYSNVYEVNVKSWRSLVAYDLEMKQNADFTKWTVKEWAKEVYPEIPDWPDLINSKGGKVPRPKSSVAKAVQPDDRFDTTGIMSWVWQEAHKNE